MIITIFFLYQQDGNYLHWLFFPAIPYLIGKFLPETLSNSHHLLNIFIWNIPFSHLFHSPNPCFSVYKYSQTNYSNFKVFSHHLYLKSLSLFIFIHSHLPQMKVCYDLRTTSGVSLLSQHFNLIGGLLGIYSTFSFSFFLPSFFLLFYSILFFSLLSFFYFVFVLFSFINDKLLIIVAVCLIIPPVSQMTYLIYGNSIFQAVSLYAMAFYFDFYVVSQRKSKVEL